MFRLQKTSGRGSCAPKWFLSDVVVIPQREIATPAILLFSGAEIMRKAKYSDDRLLDLSHGLLPSGQLMGEVAPVSWQSGENHVAQGAAASKNHAPVARDDTNRKDAVVE
eukprot:gene12547-16734_t